MPTQNDIPVAQRVSTPNRPLAKQAVAKPNPVLRSLQSVPWWAYGLAVLAFLSPIVSARIWFALNVNATSQVSTSSALTENTQPETTANNAEANSPTAVPIGSPFISSATPKANSKLDPNNPNIPQASDAPADLFGHYAYAEAPASKLRTISRAGDGYEIKLHETAAKSYLQMEADAKADGVNFAVISGFRSISEQQELFFEISKQRNQTPAERAKVSAPPGHSEHHTGYAIDIGDANVPSTNLSPSFEKTAAFQWLRNNAARYGFEMSFPPNNSQGVMYEPWHWRFVGDDTSLATFYKSSNRSNSFIQKP
ncbi:M15 family metallopeptidase [Pseudanabaena mucicola]|uniref:D-alanyl-D-alanine carboxypeptidase family protein n=1 Tax=Pseudanabaena mucicola FACHB-723 TaxID=2692860 RepID=A0ABR7ZRS4_9CYAN|nr:M15 family metallopeptidase [Pseudanabaena mucicola]MBD2186606.1 D-alanyl-D-alanine carboxypeptidase family protein [Pseudanabaena mucicola FACHB-723]